MTALWISRLQNLERSIIESEMRSVSDKPSKARSPLRSAGALQSRRDFLLSALAASALISSLPVSGSASGEVLTFKSPNGQVQFILFAAGPQLRYRVARANQIVIEPSPLVMLVDGVDLCRESTITKIERYRVNER